MPRPACTRESGRGASSSAGGGGGGAAIGRQQLGRRGARRRRLHLRSGGAAGRRPAGAGACRGPHRRRGRREGGSPRGIRGAAASGGGPGGCTAWRIALRARRRTGTGASPARRGLRLRCRSSGQRASARRAPPVGHRRPRRNGAEMGNSAAGRAAARAPRRPGRPCGATPPDRFRPRPGLHPATTRPAAASALDRPAHPSTLILPCLVAHPTGHAVLSVRGQAVARNGGRANPGRDCTRPERQMAENDKPSTPPFRLPDPELVTRTMADVAERGQRIVTDFLRRQADAAGDPDPLKIGSAFLEMTARDTTRAVVQGSSLCTTTSPVQHRGRIWATRGRGSRRPQGPRFRTPRTTRSSTCSANHTSLRPISVRGEGRGARPQDAEGGFYTAIAMR